MTSARTRSTGENPAAGAGPACDRNAALASFRAPLKVGESTWSSNRRASLRTETRTAATVGQRRCQQQPRPVPSTCHAARALGRHHVVGHCQRVGNDAQVELGRARGATEQAPGRRDGCKTPRPPGTHAVATSTQRATGPLRQVLHTLRRRDGQEPSPAPAASAQPSEQQSTANPPQSRKIVPSGRRGCSTAAGSFMGCQTRPETGF